jgi:hypothetical protein
VATTVRVTSAPATLQVGDTAALRADVLDQANRPMSRPVTWRSNDQRVARVIPGPRLVALAEGQINLTADAGDGVSGATSVRVVAVPVASVTVDPRELELEVGAPAPALRVVMSAANGAPLADRQVAWESSNESVATVSSTGRVTAVAPGVVRITATSGSRSGSAEVRVRAPARTVTAPPPAESAAPPPPAVAPQVAIAELVQSYAAALESQDVSRVKALYPTMPRQQEGDTRDALGAMENLQVRLAASRIIVEGDHATAQITGQWLFKGGQLDIRNTYEFERRSDGWKIVGIR